MTHSNEILILMGPTGSGKSAFALRIAQARPAVIINADAMQLVDTLRVITARPSEAEERAAEHALYGLLAPQESTSVAVWLRLAEPVIRAAWAAGKLPLLVGGTGMYIQSLMQGLSAIPPADETLRAQLRATYPDASDGRLYAALAVQDPAMAAKLKPGDTQRLLRALEVVQTTGRSLETWQKESKAPLFPEASYRCYYMDVTREAMYAAIDRRFVAMMHNGALDEVRALLALQLLPDTPILRAHGVPELSAYLRGELALEEAIARAQQHTRNYAKRQMTFIRNQLPDAIGVAPDSPATVLPSR